MSTLCGRDARAVKEAAGQLGWEKSATDWRAVVNDPEIDIIDISTPNDSHAEIAIASAAAGKAILCEKPLARDAAEAERMTRRYARRESSTWFATTTGACRRSLSPAR